MSDLRPCPFCGSAAKRHDIEAREDVDNAGASYIECERCAICTPLYFDRKENLYSSWNDRTPDIDREREIIAENAREWAGHYAQGSDGRNTFILLAEWIEKRMAGVAEKSGAGAPETSVRCGAPATNPSPTLISTQCSESDNG
jgi:Lar family restriction alleviation protein